MTKQFAPLRAAGSAVLLAWAAAAAAAQPDTLPPVLEDDAVVADQGSALAGLSIQAWWQRHLLRAPQASDNTARLVLDYRREWRLTPTLRASFSNQLDLARQDGAGEDAGSSVLNSMREAWLGWKQAGDGQSNYVDVGRINVRNGVASGYNPTDFFKREAASSRATTLDPGAIRNNRLGVFMLRVQHIGEAGALSVALAPKLASPRAPGDIPSDYSLALERTNGEGALFVKWAPQLSQRVSLDYLLYARRGDKPRLGLNLSSVLGEAVLLNAEWSGAQLPGLPAPDQVATAQAWRNRAALNLVWTTPLGLELTLERQYAGDALDRDAWRRWRGVNSVSQAQSLGQLARRRQQEQEPLVRQAWFARLDWRDAFGQRALDLSSFVLRNNYDHSALWQTTLSRHVGEHWTLSGQWVHYSGDARSEYGASSVRNYAAVHLDYRL